jgi:hypothetical protein
MGVLAPNTSFACVSVTLTVTRRKTTINAPYLSRQEARKLEDWLEMQPRHFLMMGINPDTYNDIVRVTFQFSGALNRWWFNRETNADIPNTFDWLYRFVRRPYYLTSETTQLRPCFYFLELRHLRPTFKRLLAEVSTTIFKRLPVRLLHQRAVKS